MFKKRITCGAKEVSIMVLILIMGLIFSWIHYYAPHVGDDMAYGYAVKVFSDKFGGNEFLGWVYYCCRHWVFSNGRMANYMASTILCWFPQWLIAVFNGIMWSYTGYIILKITNCLRGPLLLSFLILAFVWLGLPWWDSGLLTDVTLNYVYSTTFGITLAYLYIKNPFGTCRVQKLFLFFFALVTGMMHEAMSIPLLLGFFSYEYISLTYVLNLKFSWRNLDSSHRHILAGMLVGVSLVLFSPGILKRFLRTVSGMPDDPFLLLFFKSDFMVILLVTFILIMIISKGAKLKKLLRCPWIIFFVAAIVSAFFSGISGTVGRSGWFAQIYSLISITIIMRDFKWKVPISLSITGSVLLTLMILWCYISVLFWQIKRGEEYHHVMDLYVDSKDGIVYVDYTDDYEVPFQTLGITLGVPDPDDLYPIAMIEEYVGEGKPFIVLPKYLEKWDGKIEGETLKVGKGFLTTYDPSTIKIEYLNGEKELRLMERKDSIYTVTPFKKMDKEFFYVRPLDLDFGDRLLLND